MSANFWVSSHYEWMQWMLGRGAINFAPQPPVLNSGVSPVVTAAGGSTSTTAAVPSSSSSSSSNPSSSTSSNTLYPPGSGSSASSSSRPAPSPGFSVVGAAKASPSIGAARGSGPRQMAPPSDPDGGASSGGPSVFDFFCPPMDSGPENRAAISLIHVTMTHVIVDLAHTVKSRMGQHLVQKSIASAIVYFRRFYSVNSLQHIDPWLMAPTCLYVSCKAEEWQQYGPLHHDLCKNLRELMKERGYDYRYEGSHILDAEYILLKDLSFYTVLHHPYRPLMEYCVDAGLCSADLFQKDYIGQKRSLDKTTAPEQVARVAWSIVNDSFYTHLPLIHAPHLIALGALYTAWNASHHTAQGSSKAPSEMGGDPLVWFAGLPIDKMPEIVAVSCSLVQMYHDWRNDLKWTGGVWKAPDQIHKASAHWYRPVALQLRRHSHHGTAGSGGGSSSHSSAHGGHQSR